VAIGESVTKDWKANASSGVAILKHNYDLVSLSEGQRASSEDVALAAYSAYNHGTRRWHQFLERDKNGIPKDGGVRNFYRRYRQSPER